MERLEKAYKEIVYKLSHKILLGTKARLDLELKPYLSDKRNLWINNEMSKLWSVIKIDWHYNLTALFILWYMIHYGKYDLDLDRLRLEMKWSRESQDKYLWEV